MEETQKPVSGRVGHLTLPPPCLMFENVIHPSGTFRYTATVPDNPEDVWDVRLLESLDGNAIEPLVGPSPHLSLSDVGITQGGGPSSPVSHVVLPNVFGTRVTLFASNRDRAFCAAIAFVIDKGVASRFRPGDIVHFVRTSQACLGFSVIRSQEVVMAAGAVTHVPLDQHVSVQRCVDLTRKAQEVFRQRDPEFHLLPIPIEVRIDNHVRLLVTGRYEIGDYVVLMNHAYFGGFGPDECLSVSRKGVFPESPAFYSALLLNSSQTIRRWVDVPEPPPSTGSRRDYTDSIRKWIGRLGF